MSIIEVVNIAEAGPLCVNCANAQFKIGPSLLCAAPSVRKVVSLVTGAQLGPHCVDQRADAGDCKKEGQLYEPAPVTGNRLPYEMSPGGMPSRSLSSLSNKNLASAVNSAATATTSLAVAAAPNTVSQMALAVTNRS